MKYIKFFLLVAMALGFASCGPTRYTTSNVNLSTVDEFAFIQPYSYIVVYNDENKGYYEEESSDRATNIITNIISMERFPFSDVIPADYKDANSDIAKWMGNFPDVDPSKIGRMRVPKSLHKLIADSGNRYGIVIYSYGYIQTKAGYQREKVEKAASKVLDSAIEKLTGISGLTNPSKNYYVSDPYGNILYCAVVDSQTDEVVHFVNETPTLASHPTENRDVNELVHKLLKEFIR